MDLGLAAADFVALGQIRDFHPHARDLLARRADRINADEPQYVFLLGDLTLDATDPEWGRVQSRLLDRLEAPYFIAAGNHDVKLGRNLHAARVGYLDQWIPTPNAAGASAPEFLQATLGHGGDPNLVAGSSMKTPPFYALRSGTRNIELLLDAGANIDHTHANGDSAVMVAAALGRFDLAYLLLSRGASYELRNRSGAWRIGLQSSER